MYQSGKSLKTAKEMGRCRIEILGLSEVRSNTAGMTTLNTGHTIIYSGTTNSTEAHDKGVGFMLTKKAKQSLLEWNPVSSRIITASVLENLHDDETNINTAWEMTRDSIVQSCEETVGYLQQNCKQWMSENKWKIVNERRQVIEKVLTAITKQQKAQTQEQYSNKDKEQLSGKPPISNTPFKDKDNKTLTQLEEQLERWKEHFEQVLNRPRDPPELQNGPTLNIKTSKITKAEVTEAIKSLKNGKAGGIDNIPPEAIKVLDDTSKPGEKQLHLSNQHPQHQMAKQSKMSYGEETANNSDNKNISGWHTPNTNIQALE
ncbi:unnamed protein product [Mytilus coruscus]|uniref:Reverse transcriptase domain-containing protein n=1 Tax=Mytilus coruscus TaxID=42192 RepID=A0A6J8ARC4_MYTCO|nr:unnamed protein product [Mytilus coruscus]